MGVVQECLLKLGWESGLKEGIAKTNVIQRIWKIIGETLSIPSGFSMAMKFPPRTIMCEGAHFSLEDFTQKGLVGGREERGGTSSELSRNNHSNGVRFKQCVCGL